MWYVSFTLKIVSVFPPHIPLLSPHDPIQSACFSLHKLTSPLRKHNPATIHNSESESTQRLSQMKNLSMFYTDLANQQLPQWMFITPNELNDGHDTGVTYAGNWLHGFLTPLLNNSYFMENTLILVTFDETETYTKQNNVYTFLLGGAVPQNLVGTTDNNYYNH